MSGLLSYVMSFVPSSGEQETSKDENKQESFSFADTKHALPNMKILYGTQKGTAHRFANMLKDQALEKGWDNVSVIDLEEYEFDELNSEELVIYIVATYIEGTCVHFLHLNDQVCL